MKIEELIAKFKEAGKSDEEVKAELEALKKEIEAFLEPAPPAPPAEEEKPSEEEEEKKMHEVFGI